MLDLFGWLRRKDGARRKAPAGARRSIAPPVDAPMFSDRVETMNQQRAPTRQEPRARQDRRRQPRAHSGDGDARQDTQGFLAAHGVERSFVGRKVVKGVSLYVRRGEAVGLLGPNGAGKTTVFYMITGLVKADRGRIELDGHDVTALPMYQRARLGIGYLPQEASIFRGLNVEDNIRAVLEVVEPSRKRREYDLDALLEEFNIARLRGRNRARARTAAARCAPGRATATPVRTPTAFSPRTASNAASSAARSSRA